MTAEMSIAKGIKLLDDMNGNGLTAEKGDKVVYNWKLYLNRGDEVPLNQTQVNNLPGHLKHLERIENGYSFIDHTSDLGKREPIRYEGRGVSKSKGEPSYGFWEEGAR